MPNNFQDGSYLIDNKLKSCWCLKYVVFVLMFYFYFYFCGD